MGIKQSQAQANTALEALKAGQDDIREKMATKEDIHRLEQKIDRVGKDVKSHKSRIENLEEHTGIPIPTFGQNRTDGPIFLIGKALGYSPPSYSFVESITPLFMNIY